MSRLLIAAALALGTLATPALAKTTVIVTDDAPAVPTNISACSFDGLPPILMFTLETPRSITNRWVQVGDNAPVEWNLAAQFSSWEFGGNEYYLTDDALSVTKKGETQGTDHKGECISLINPAGAK